jgi:hypothetical protein
VIAYRPQRATRSSGSRLPDRQYALLERLGFDRDGGEVIAPTPGGLAT